MAASEVGEYIPLTNVHGDEDAGEAFVTGPAFGSTQLRQINIYIEREREIHDDGVRLNPFCKPVHGSRAGFCHKDWCVYGERETENAVKNQLLKLKE